VNQVFIRLMNEAVTDLVQETSRRIADAKVRSVADVRASQDDLAGFSDEGTRRHDGMHRFLYGRFYTHWKVARMQENAKRFLTTVFDYYAGHPRVLPPDVRAASEKFGLHVAVKDFVAAMTDRELHQEYRRIVMP
jgi:dGTPase